MTDEKIRELLKNALEKVAPERGLHLGELDFATPIKDLGLDSVTSMDLVCALEDSTGRRFGDEELSKVRRLRDLAALLSADEGLR